MEKITALITVPQPLRGNVLSQEALTKLESFANVTMNEDGHNWSGEELAARLPGVDAIIASWGLATFTPEVLAKADRLRIVAYGAGSVKRFATQAFFERGIVLTHAAARIGASVADFSLLLAMIGLRRPERFDREMKAKVPSTRVHGLKVYEITGKKVGLLGMGYVGRQAAKLFNGVGAEVWAYDPYMSEARAKELGVHKAELDDLLRSCKVISVHLPVTDETHHMLGTRELALIQDDAVFVNTARSWVVDQDALVKELASGRFWAALDVYDKEPLPMDHPLRDIDNVFLTPHVAGGTIDSYSNLMAEMIDETERFLEGEPLKYQVTQDMLATMG